MKKPIILIAHNIRSAHNIGSLFRTAEGFGVSKLYLTGYSPYPTATDDERLPHEVLKTSRQIEKTALGAQQSIKWQHASDLEGLVTELKDEGYLIIALEQSSSSKPINKFKLNQPMVLIVGNEVDGIDSTTLKLADKHLEIPMSGKKESFNVASAAAVALYHLTFIA